MLKLAFDYHYQATVMLANQKSGFTIHLTWHKCNMAFFVLHIFLTFWWILKFPDPYQNLLTFSWLTLFLYQGSHGSGKSQEKEKIWQSEEKVSKFWYGSGNLKIHQKVRKMVRKMDLISIWMPNSTFWLSVLSCVCLVLQEMQEMQENWEHISIVSGNFVNQAIIQ